ncbi:MAG: type II toxin-antitoxin system VapC family toxin [Anaerolineales bacterium]|nr:type II toxin-antitoxin system VapC family toxin [Anaerolineales bacterium]
MNIVVDASITLALFVKLPYSDAAENAFRSWRRQGDRLYAPGLWPVEIASALRKTVSVGQITSDYARLILAGLENRQVEIIHPDTRLLDLSYLWAERISQRVTYDSQYLALAQTLQAVFWSADHRLVSSLQAMDIPWAHCIRSSLHPSK